MSFFWLQMNDVHLNNFLVCNGEGVEMLFQVAPLVIIGNPSDFSDCDIADHLLSTLTRGTL